jgi:hypothetical protein
MVTPLASFRSLWLTACGLALAPAASADPAPALPELHHAPVSNAQAAHPLQVLADFAHPEALAGGVLLHRAAGEKEYHEVPFQRSAQSYLAVIGPESVRDGGLSYAIELELPDGKRLPGFASREHPFEVQVQLDEEEAAEKAALRRVNGLRSTARASAEWVTFGKSTRLIPGNGSDAPPEARSVDDNYYRLEASYAYRPLRTISEFGVRLGLVRGTSPHANGESGEKQVGLNYAAPWVQLRMADSVHLSGHLVTGVTEVDFSMGAGAELTLGDPYGGNLSVGFESIQGFGSRFFTKVDIGVSDRILLSPIIEATNMPNADEYGVRLLAQLGVQLSREFRLSALGGYQARNAVSGGPSLGLSSELSF